MGTTQGKPSKIKGLRCSSPIFSLTRKKASILRKIQLNRAVKNTVPDMKAGLD